MLKPEIVATNLSNGNSAVFNAQWYPNVTAVLECDYGSAGELHVTLQGSLDNSKWVDIGSTQNYSSGATHDLHNVAGTWFLYYRLHVECGEAETFVQKATMGAAGS